MLKWNFYIKQLRITIKITCYTQLSFVVFFRNGSVKGEKSKISSSGRVQVSYQQEIQKQYITNHLNNSEYYQDVFYCIGCIFIY